MADSHPKGDGAGARRASRSSMWIRVLPAGIVALAAVLLIWNPFDREASVDEPPESVVPRGDAGEAISPTSADDPRAARWEDLTGDVPSWPADFGAAASCAEAASALRALCDRLDRADPGAGGSEPGATFGLLSNSLRDLAARPPVIAGELTEHESMLANVAHAFRVLGPARISRIAELATRHPDAAEPLALAVFQWIRALPATCGDESAPPFDLGAQYAYAVYLTRTIGGQAYLRRRAPVHEALASFYAVVLQDAAVAAGHDPVGIDPRGEIARARTLVAGHDLVFEDRYVAVLDELRKRWDARASGRP